MQEDVGTHKKSEPEGISPFLKELTEAGLFTIPQGFGVNENRLQTISRLILL